MIGNEHGKDGYEMKEESSQAMEVLDKLHQPHNQETQKQQESGTRKWNEVTQRLWARMMDLYGRQWESSYGAVGEHAFITWMEAMSSLNVNQIKAGLDAVIEEGSEFPPNLIKFLRLCRTTQHTSHKMVDLAALPPPNVHKRPEVIAEKEKHFQAVRDLLHSTNRGG